MKTEDQEINEYIEVLAHLAKLNLALESLKSCDYLKNIANFSLNSMCETGLRNYYFSHFGLIIAFFGFIIQFLGNYYGEIYIGLQIYQVNTCVIYFLIFFIG